MIPGIKKGERWFNDDMVHPVAGGNTAMFSLEASRGNRAWCEALHRGDWSGVGKHEVEMEPVIYGWDG